MQNHDEILQEFREYIKKYNNRKGFAFLIAGESGIGKTELAKSISNIIDNECCLFKISGKSIPGGQPFGCFYDAAYKALHNSDIKHEYWIELIKEFSIKLPGLGKYISALNKANEYNSLAKIMKLSGFKYQTSSAPNACSFINMIAKENQVVFIIDDAQWIDLGTFEFLRFSLEHLDELNWGFLILINDSVSPHPEIKNFQAELKTLFKNQSKGYFKAITPKRWDQINLKNLISAILNVDFCEFTKSQIEVLHKTTSGIPKFVEEVLLNLIEEKYIFIKNKVAKSNADWREIDMPSSLQELLKKKLQQLYFQIENSRKVLEVASVIGETFTDESVQAVSKMDDVYSLLTKIEYQSKVIKDLFDHHKWQFNHALNHKTIYNSIGENVLNLHEKVASYLISIKSKDYEAIAFHLRKANLKEKSLKYDLKNAETLLNSALFRSAIEKSRIIEENAKKLTFDKEFSYKACYIKGQSFFYLNLFDEAILIFFKLLKNNNQNLKLVADVKRWIGRCYTSKCSQEEFGHGVKHLEKAYQIYKKIGDKSNCAVTLSDLTVTYEHQNRFKDTELAYRTAEKLFIQSKNEVGLNQLWRRSGMVLDAELGTKVIKKATKNFSQWGMPHEEVMCLNNIAVNYLYLGNEELSKKYLEKAIEISSRIDNFGMDHILINLGINSLLMNDIKASVEIINKAYQLREREVTNLNMDILGAAIGLRTLPLKEATIRCFRVYKQSIQEGELSYIIPALINYSYALEKIGHIEKAIHLLEKVRPIKVPYQRYYAHCQQSKWFFRLINLYSLKGFNKKKIILQKKISWCKPFENIRFYNADFGAVPVQFCSP